MITNNFNVYKYINVKYVSETGKNIAIDYFDIW